MGADAKWHRENNTDVAIKRRESIRLINSKRLKNDAAYREKLRHRNRVWNKTNRARANAKSARRRALKFNATLRCVSKKRLTEIYRECPKGFHVDHIFPLKGVGFTGLHVPWNLQYLSGLENQSKFNKTPVGVHPLAYPSGSGVLV